MESVSLHYTFMAQYSEKFSFSKFYLTYFTTVYQFAVLFSQKGGNKKALKVYLQQLFLQNNYTHTCFRIWQLPFENVYAVPLARRNLKQSPGNNQTLPTLEFLIHWHKITLFSLDIADVTKMLKVTYGFPPGIPARFGGIPGTLMWGGGSNPTWQWKMN